MGRGKSNRLKNANFDNRFIIVAFRSTSRFRSENMYDVIIIGAGPAGTTAAKVLAEGGFKVLLVEKFKMPRYKSCSGQLIKKTLDLVQRYFGETVLLSTMCTPTENRGMIFTDDKGKRFVFEQKGLNVWRSSFDNWLAERAALHGAEIRDGTSAISCKECGDLGVKTKPAFF